jgi:hypothetical protein
VKQSEPLLAPPSISDKKVLSNLDPEEPLDFDEVENDRIVLWFFQQFFASHFHNPTTSATRIC